MIFLLLIGSIGLAIYGVSTGNVPVLVLAALAMAIASSRLSDSQKTAGLERIRSWGDALGPAPWLPALIATLVCAGLAIVRIREADPDPVGIGLWAASLLLAVITGIIYDRDTVFWRRAREEVRWERLDWLIALGLMLVALALRVYLLDRHLPAMHGDEGEMGVLARLALYGPGGDRGPNPLHYFRTAFLDHPNLFHYVQAIGLWVFGDSEWGLKMASVVFGAFCAPLAFAAGRIGWGRTSGIVAGWLLAVSHLNIQFSRIALNNIHSVWFAALFFVLLMIVYAGGKIRSERRETATDGTADTPHFFPDARLTIFILIGLVVGLSQYFYYGSRLIAVLAVPLLLMLWRERRAAPLYILAAGASSIMAFLPMIDFYIKDFAPFLNRMRGVSVLKQEGIMHVLGPDAIWPNDLPTLLREQIERNVSFFVRAGDASAFYIREIPGFDMITVVLFWLGIGLLFGRWRHFPNRMMAWWFVIGLFLGGVVTNDAPNSPRLLIVALAVYFIASIPFQYLFDAIQSLWPSLHRRTPQALVAILCAVTLYLNFDLYFVQFARINPMLPLTEIATAMEDHGKSERVYLLGDPVLYAEHGVPRFIAKDVPRNNLLNLGDLPTLAADAMAAGQGVYLIVLTPRLADLPAIMQMFPDGLREEHYDHLNRLLFVSYQIPA